MYQKQRSIALVFLAFLLTPTSVLFSYVGMAHAQATPSYWVTVTPATPSSIMYSTVKHNVTISFRATWTFGDKSGQAIKNANITIEIRTKNGEIVDTTRPTTNDTGFASFNYSISTPDILTFKPLKLITQDGIEWNSSLLGRNQNSLYGFQSTMPISVYYDTFAVSLVSADTNTQGTTRVSVNITHLIVPEEGLTLPFSSSYLNQTYFPKIAHNASVTINGVKAIESSVPGIYSANFSTWLPTAYVFVGVSQEGWSPYYKGFSFDHNSNEAVWIPSIIGLSFLAMLFSLFFPRKSRVRYSVDRSSFPVFGGILLAVASFISFYWGVVGLDSTLHGFDWILLGLCGLGSFGLGIVGSIFSMKRKHQTLAIFTVIAPLLTNVIAIKSSLDVYQLANPWFIIAVSLVISTASGILISNSDEQFSRTR